MNGITGLTEAEQERLYLLAEEAGEVVQAAMKVLRHGYGSSHPNGGPNNREQLADEIGHLHTAVQRMIAKEDVTLDEVQAGVFRKRAQGNQYTHFQ